MKKNTNRGILVSVLGTALVAFVIFIATPISYAQWDTYGGAGNTFGGYDNYGWDTFGGYDNYGWDTFGGYDNYGWNTFGGYDNYGWNTFGGYDNYGWDTFGGYDNYGWNTFGGYDNYGWDTFGGYDNYGWDTFGGYDNYGWDTFGGYDNYNWNTGSGGGYTDYALAAAQGYTDYALCGGGNCGTAGGGTTGGSRGGSRGTGQQAAPASRIMPGGGGGLGGLGLNLTSVDNSVTNTICSYGDHNCNTITTVTTVATDNSINDSFNNNNNQHIVRRDDDRVDTFRAICIPSHTRVNMGDRVSYRVDISGGERPYRIQWSGDISGDNEVEHVRFNRAGRYQADVTVRDNTGRQVRDTCSTVIVEDDRPAQQVTVTTNPGLGTPTGNLASLDAVFLSQVPYTGSGSILKVVGALALITLVTAGIMLYAKRRSRTNVVRDRIAMFKEGNKYARVIR